jgi:hypothetical protein
MVAMVGCLQIKEKPPPEARVAVVVFCWGASLMQPRGRRLTVFQARNVRSSGGQLRMHFLYGDDAQVVHGFHAFYRRFGT